MSHDYDLGNFVVRQSVREDKSEPWGEVVEIDEENDRVRVWWTTGITEWVPMNSVLKPHVSLYFMNDD